MGELEQSTRDTDQVTEAAKPDLEEPSAKPAPEVIQEMEEESMKVNEPLMVDAAKKELRSKENALQASAEKQAEAEAAHAVETIESRGDDLASIASGVEGLAAARERLGVASTDAERQAALTALQRLEDGLVDKTDMTAEKASDLNNSANGNVTTVDANATELSSEPGATLTHGFTLKGLSMEVIQSNLNVFQEAVSSSMTEAVSGLDKVVVEKETPGAEGAEGAEGGEAAVNADSTDALIHVGYEVVLKSGIDSTSKTVELVQLDVTVLTSILESKLQDAGMNVAGIQVIKMDEKADVTGGEPAATGGETGATGTACDGCETDPAVTSKIENLEGTVQDQTEKLTALENQLANMKETTAVAATVAATGAADATGGSNTMLKDCLHGDCDLLTPLPSDDVSNATDVQNNANQAS